MTITKHGKCATCDIPCKVSRMFLTPVDLFTPEAAAEIKGDLTVNIKAWRDSPMYCSEHQL